MATLEPKLSGERKVLTYTYMTFPEEKVALRKYPDAPMVTPSLHWGFSWKRDHLPSDRARSKAF